MYFNSLSCIYILFQSERSVSMAGDEIIEYEEFENDREVEQTTHIPTFQVYQQYLRAGVSPVYCVVVAALFILTQILISSFDYWIAYWFVLLYDE